MSKRRTVADMQPGAIVRAGDGILWRIGQLSASSPEGKYRWGRRLRDDMRETDDVVWLHPSLAVLEVVQEPSKASTSVGGGGDWDPLRSRLA